MPHGDGPNPEARDEDATDTDSTGTPCQTLCQGSEEEEEEEDTMFLEHSDLDVQEHPDLMAVEEEEGAGDGDGDGDGDAEEWERRAAAGAGGEGRAGGGGGLGRRDGREAHRHRSPGRPHGVRALPGVRGGRVRLGSRRAVVGGHGPGAVRVGTGRVWHVRAVPGLGDLGGTPVRAGGGTLQLWCLWLGPMALPSPGNDPVPDPSWVSSGPGVPVGLNTGIACRRINFL
jgi:hypothetical protein